MVIRVIRVMFPSLDIFVISVRIVIVVIRDMTASGYHCYRAVLVSLVIVGFLAPIVVRVILVV